MANSPHTFDQVLRDLARRITLLERSPRPLRSKDWLVEQRADGALVARHVPSGTQTVIASPPP